MSKWMTPTSAAKRANMHQSKRERLGLSPARSMVGKVAVMGLLERHGNGSRVRTVVLSGRKEGNFQPHVREHIEAGSTINTDAHMSYKVPAKRIRAQCHRPCRVLRQRTGSHQRLRELLVA